METLYPWVVTGETVPSDNQEIGSYHQRLSLAIQKENVANLPDTVPRGVALDKLSTK